MDAEPVAVSCVAETKVVVSGAVPSRTCAPETKLLPVTARVKLPVPTFAGFVPTSPGVGLSKVTSLDAFAEPEATLVAVMVSVLGLGSDQGAV